MEVALIVLLAGVIAFHGWAERRHVADRRRDAATHATERNRLLDALVARNATEYAGLRQVEETARRPPRQLEDADFQVGS